MQREGAIALVAHDQMKDAMVAFVHDHQAVLAEFALFATGTTGARVMEACPALTVTRLKSGPVGGDQQIGALIADGKVSALIFFIDPLSPLPHDVDVKALTRLAVHYDIPMALNRRTADILLARPEALQFSRSDAVSGYLDHLPFPILIGDIGGTNARFALIDGPDAAVRRLPNVHTADFPTIDDAIADAVVGKAGTKPKAAVLALAGPITGDSVQLTNCDWIVTPKTLIARFGIAEVVLLNDFEAQSLGLPELGAGDIDMVGGGTVADGARVVIGPGTGLGAGALVFSRAIWIPIPGEGGHVGLGPVTARDLEVWPHIERHGPRVSAETVLCGAGMVRLYKAVCASDGVAPRFDTPAEITANGLSGDDAQAKETLAIFAEHLGRVAGDTALVFMARGGVYLAGGITARIAPVLKAGGFRAAFVDKWPHGKLMEGMATAIITKEDAALAGIAAFARTPTKFGVEVGGRRWRG